MEDRVVPACPKVSIVTPSLNSEKFLEETIRSVREQTYGHIEYIVIDGGSTDGTTGIIRKHAKEIDHWVSEPDKGISDAFNKGILASTGEIIGFLNSQDTYCHGDVIRKIVDAFDENPAVKIVYGKTYYVPIDSKEIVGVMGERFSEKRMNRRNIMPHQSVFVKREVFDRFGLFPVSYKSAMDYEFLLRATKAYPPRFLDEGLAVMRLGGMSDTRKFAVCRELFRAQISTGCPFPGSLAALLVHYVTSAGLRALRPFHIYTLRHLYKKIGMIKEIS
jgi:glycosyltransferase involved in cell wall biosynthesis